MPLLSLTMFPGRGCCVLSALCELLSSALDFSWLCCELSCWHCPRSLSLPPSLALSPSLSLDHNPPPLLNSSSSVWQHLCGCQREGDGFDLNINAFMYSMCMLCEAKGEGKMKGNDLRPVFPTRVQSQLHPMHYPYWADKKKAVDGEGGTQHPKETPFPVVLSHH